MRSYTVDTSAVKISVNGAEFDLLKSDAVAQAEIMQYLARVRSVHADCPEEVEAVLRAGCNLLDAMLGTGASIAIFGSTPVSLARLLGLLKQICEDCFKAYRNYLKTEYLED